MMEWLVGVKGGEAPVVADEAGSDRVFILAHGAGSHLGHGTITWLAGILRDAGYRVVRFNFLYRALGKSIPDRMPVLIETYRAVIESVCEKLAPKELVVGGHSMGGRVASMLEAEGQTADRLVLFGYPLHPVGKTEQLRDGHLARIRVPVLQLNGSEDPFCQRDLMESVLTRLGRPDGWRMHWIEGADHSYAVRKSSGRTRADVREEILREILKFGEGGR